jgi:hypothetical protein
VTFPFWAAAAGGDHRPARASLVMGSATAHRNGSLQSRRNKTVAGILENQSDGDGGA